MSRRAREHARRLVSQLLDTEREYLCENPLVALELLGFEVRLRPESSMTGPCTVSGSYDAGPPETITIVETRSVGRQYFTALHEFGHRLSNTDAELHDAFAEERDGGERLEEEVCDAVAAELLLPDFRVDECIGERGPTAQGVVDLFHNSKASREACCVRAAQRMLGAGYVMLATDGIARFTASSRTPYPVRRNTPLPPDHPIWAAYRRTVRGRAPVVFASGAVSGQYFLDAVGDDDYVFAVFTDSKPAWIRGLAIMDADDVTATAEAYCPWCEVDFEGYGAPCPKCRGYVHRRSSCGKCACEPDRTPGEKQCLGCFIVRPPENWKLGGDQCDICVEG